MSDGNYVTHQILNEFAKRIDQEDMRQNERMDRIEKSLEAVNTIAIAVEKLAVNMEALTKEVSKQGSKLDELEMKPAKRWDLVVTTVIAGILGAMVTLATRGFVP